MKINPIIKKIQNSTYLLSIQGEPVGSALTVSSDGSNFLTALHNLDGSLDSNAITLSAYSSKTNKFSIINRKIKVDSTWNDIDLALLKLDNGYRELVTRSSTNFLEIGHQNPPIGSTVYVCGFEKFIYSSKYNSNIEVIKPRFFEANILIKRIHEDEEHDDYILNRILNSGNSGGPVVDTSGCVVGICENQIEKVGDFIYPKSAAVSLVDSFKELKERINSY